MPGVSYHEIFTGQRGFRPGTGRSVPGVGLSPITMSGVLVNASTQE